MALRQRLMDDQEHGSEIINSLIPENISARDLLTLTKIRKMNPRDPLAFLGLEAEWWLKDNLSILKDRFSL